MNRREAYVLARCALSEQLRAELGRIAYFLGSIVEDVTRGRFEATEDYTMVPSVCARSCESSAKHAKETGETLVWFGKALDGMRRRKLERFSACT
jgi:hypothetical protein